MSTQDNTNSNSGTAPKAVKPCPRCGSAAGKGNGGSMCLCKKGKNAKNIVPGSAPEPCDAPIKKDGAASTTTGKGGCGCK